jgi:ferredoxin
VHITFVNYAGERQRLPARVGDSLLDVAVRYGYKYVDGACGGGGSPVDVLHKEGQWFEPKYGEGASCYYCHVIIPKSHYDLLPAKRPDETDQLLQYPFKEDLAET